MIPGPAIIIKCPHCRRLTRERSLTSGNTFGATYWTDGEMDAPMLPDIPAIGACPNCGRSFWFNDAKRVGEIELFALDDSVPPEWRAVPDAIVLDEEKLLDAIDNGLGNSPERNKYLRLSAWHAFNDRFRGDEPSQKFDLGNRQRANMEELENLFQWSEEWDDLFILVEVCRQLGKFEKAQNFLGHINVEFILAKKTLISELCNQQSRVVRRIPLADEKSA
jgi:hypothetical protein